MLYLTQELPDHADTGHKIRTLQLLSAAASEFATTVAGFVDMHAGESQLGRVLPDVSIISEPQPIRIRRDPMRLAATLGQAYASRRPYSLQKFSNPRLSARLAALSRVDTPDIVFSTVQMSAYLRLFPTAIQVVDAHNIEHRLWESFRLDRWLARCVARREGRYLAALETRLWRECAGVVAICREDAEIVHEAAANTMTVVIPPWARPPTGSSSTLAQADVGLLGVWSWAPNEAALEVVAQQLAPELAARGVTLRVSGPGVSESMQRRLLRLGVDVTGYLPQLSSFYDSVDQILAPYWEGGGVRLKVLEAIACGKPVVGTPLAFRGILGAAEHAKGDTPSCLVQQVLANKAGLGAARMRARALREQVTALHCPRKSGETLVAFFGSLLADREARAARSATSLRRT
ncbi:glycosyltransferase [Phenylobacterium sp.]|uniref:glycosyltransferase n=1 Tax=Phenylobacterium sp. TaxID=1871053 RepID=UPI00301E51A4